MIDRRTGQLVPTVAELGGAGAHPCGCIIRRMRVLDWLAHQLYEPALLGRRARAVRHEWAHKIHLIPGAWLEWVCSQVDHQGAS